MVYGAILAGGIGKRMTQRTVPKQFINIDGTPIIIRTLNKFLENDRIEMIYISVHPDWIVYTEDMLKQHISDSKSFGRIKVISGGKERIDSFLNIVDDIEKENGINERDIIICNDAVRPFINKKMLDDCIDYTLKYDLSLTVVPAIDTIYISHDGEFIDSTLPRKTLYNGQTPSGFRVKDLFNLMHERQEEELHQTTGTTQAFLEKGMKAKIVDGFSNNIKITTDYDLPIAKQIIESEYEKTEYFLLDCTLRDGGIAIGFEFGTERMRNIKSALEESGVEYIECGYIDEKKGKKSGITCFDSDLSLRDELLLDYKKNEIKYLAMIDYGTYDVKRLHSAEESNIDGIRLAFHKENLREALDVGKDILDKGYELFIQPMVSYRYTDSEFCQLIHQCNDLLPQATAFYIVDSFGQMDTSSLVDKIKLADLYVRPEMKLGFHGHNNRQLAFSNAKTILETSMHHDFILDACIMGMGKGAGNLCTELIIPQLISFGKNYDSICIYNQINEYFSKVIKEHPWGYNLDYYLSSVYGCTPSYINIFNKDERVTTDVLIDLLSHIATEKKHACDRKYAKQYLDKYFSEENADENI